MGWHLAVWGGALYRQVTGKLMIAQPGWFMLAARGTLTVADQGRMMMAKAERDMKVDRGRGRASVKS